MGTVTKWVSGEFPGWIEVRVPTVEGTATLVDKVSVLARSDIIRESTPLPANIRIACKITGRVRGADGREVVVVTLSHGVTDVEDNRVLQVFADQVIDD